MIKSKFAPVSVIIPCYNCESTIERAVKSVVDQTLKPTEVILVDDASTDGTLNSLLELEEKYGPSWLKVVSLRENSGPSVARNAGWDKANQPYIAFLDADDSWHPSKLEIQYNWMKCHPDVAMTCHLCEWVKTWEPNHRLPKNWQAKPISRFKLLLKNCISTRTVMLKRELTYRFAPHKRYSEDYLLWLTILLSGHSVWSLEIPLAYYYKAPFGQGGLSGNLKAMALGEVDTYKQLYSMYLIGSLELKGLIYWSYLRYLRRIVYNIFKLFK